METFFDNLPVYVKSAIAILAAAKTVTMFTPTTVDNKIVNFALKVLNIVAGNVLKDKNADDK